MAFVKVEQVLKFKDKGVSVEAAKAAMFAAGQAPRGIVEESSPSVTENDGEQGFKFITGESQTPADPPVYKIPKRPTQAKLTVLNADGTDSENVEILTGISSSDLDRQIKVIGHKASRAGVVIRVDLIPAE
jgi:hypothetical protein